ncbi:hypothetical protein L5515_003934 [Caenorhabditis briggsae]|uniref:Uncharacterized protein n=1 Tax=Caenorhabditis briggsae TaxID=6238 RepID=A0AAE9JCM8_CAEBR|nr:hypothetical protein L5515_003934 [Caenorhabditis briggsae]
MVSKRLEKLKESVHIEFLNNYQTFHRHQKRKTSDGREETTTYTEEITVDQLPSFLHPNGIALPQKTDGEMPPIFPCPILTDFLMLKDSTCNPSKFLDDVDVFTTLSSIRSLVCQWVNYNGPKSLFFKKNPHFCHMDNQGRVYLNTGTNYTVPYERSTSFLNRFTILEHGQTWDEFIATSYSGLAKIRLKNGMRVAFTYKMYSQSDSQPVDIVIRSAGSFQKEIEFHFMNCLLTEKKIWRYEFYRKTTIFRESLSAEDLWNRMPPEQQLKVVDCFESRLPDFLLEVAYGIESEDVVNVIRSVINYYVHMTKKPDLETLY